MQQPGELVDIVSTPGRGTIDSWTLALPINYASGFSSQPPRQVPQSIFLQKPPRTDTLRQALITVGMPVSRSGTSRAQGRPA